MSASPRKRRNLNVSDDVEVKVRPNRAQRAALRASRREANTEMSDDQRKSAARKADIAKAQQVVDAVRVAAAKKAAHAKQTAELKVYCICRQPDDGEGMVQCDECGEWLHFACIRIKPSKKRVFSGDFECPICNKKDLKSMVNEAQSISELLPALKSITLEPLKKFLSEQMKSADVDAVDESVVVEQIKPSKRAHLAKKSAAKPARCSKSVGVRRSSRIKQIAEKKAEAKKKSKQ